LPCSCFKSAQSQDLGAGASDGFGAGDGDDVLGRFVAHPDVAHRIGDDDAVADAFEDRLAPAKNGEGLLVELGRAVVGMCAFKGRLGFSAEKLRRGRLRPVQSHPDYESAGVDSN
jgi:hypothetical protein